MKIKYDHIYARLRGENTNKKKGRDDETSHPLLTLQN